MFKKINVLGYYAVSSGITDVSNEGGVFTYEVKNLKVQAI
jgi:hypothetical protein